MASRTSGYTLATLPEPGVVRFTASLPAAGLSVAVPANLLAYGQAVTLTGITLPSAGQVELAVSGGGDLRLAYGRDLTLDIGELVSLDFLLGRPVVNRVVGGMTVLFANTGSLPTGEPLICELRRTQPSYLLEACSDRLHTYRGYQLWRWDYGSRVNDLLDTTAGTDEVLRELRATFVDIAGAQPAEVTVESPLPYRFAGRVRVEPEEVDFDL